MASAQPYELPNDLPVPEDDGAADHLPGCASFRPPGVDVGRDRRPFGTPRENRRLLLPDDGKTGQEPTGGLG